METPAAIREGQWPRPRGGERAGSQQDTVRVCEPRRPQTLSLPADLPGAGPQGGAADPWLWGTLGSPPVPYPQEALTGAGGLWLRPGR